MRKLTGKDIRQFRELTGLSAMALSNLLGRSERMIQRYESAGDHAIPRGTEAVIDVMLGAVYCQVSARSETDHEFWRGLPLEYRLVATAAAERVPRWTEILAAMDQRSAA